MEKRGRRERVRERRRKARRTYSGKHIHEKREQE